MNCTRVNTKYIYVYCRLTRNVWFFSKWNDDVCILARAAARAAVSQPHTKSHTHKTRPKHHRDTDNWRRRAYPNGDWEYTADSTVGLPPDETPVFPPSRRRRRTKEARADDDGRGARDTHREKSSAFFIIIIFFFPYYLFVNRESFRDERPACVVLLFSCLRRWRHLHADIISTRPTIRSPTRNDENSATPSIFAERQRPTEILQRRTRIPKTLGPFQDFVHKEESTITLSWSQRSTFFCSFAFFETTTTIKIKIL